MIDIDILDLLPGCSMNGGHICEIFGPVLHEDATALWQVGVSMSDVDWGGSAVSAVTELRR